MIETKPLTGVLCLLAVVAIIGAAFYSAQPPAPLGKDAPADKFSAARAHDHNLVVAKEPHGTGTVANDKVRDYIADTMRGYGLEVEIDQKTANYGSTISFVENVMARIPGTANAKPFVMTAHYDSTPTGNGAADDGSGVVVMLESARALMQQPRHMNDIVFVFTSDEENGQRAARAALDHPWLKDTMVVLGFEGRGTYGPAFMFETSNGNYELMKELAAAGAPAQSTSLMYEVHRRTPNSTDFEHFKRAGYLGYNVAFVGGLGYYHSRHDNPDMLSKASLQHMGGYASALVKHYGDRTEPVAQSEDGVFFNIGSMLLVYPASFSMPITVIAVAFALLAIAMGRRARLYTMPQFLGALGLTGVALFITAVAGALLVYFGYKAFYVYITYNADYYILASLFWSVAVFLGLFRLTRKRVSAPAFYAAILLLWALAAGFLQVQLPIASYVAAWPALIGAIALIASAALARRDHASFVTPILLLGALPGAVFAIPGIYGLHLIGAAITVVPCTLLFLLIIINFAPAIAALRAPRAAWAPGIAAACAALMAAYAAGSNGFDALQPKYNCIFYAYNMDTNLAVWASTDQEPDAWTSQFLGESPERARISGILPDHKGKFMMAMAPKANIPAPQMEILEEKIEGAERTLKLRYTSPRKASEANITVLGNTHVRAASHVDEPLIDGGPNWNIRFPVLPRTGIVEFTITVDAGDPIHMRVEEETYDVPIEELGYTLRPDWMSTKPNTLGWWESIRSYSGRSYVVKEFDLGTGLNPTAQST